MDRNIIVHKLDRFFRVATHEGGVDRNMTTAQAKPGRVRVATHEGGVDRNVDIIARAADRAICRHPRGWRG